MSYPDFPVGPHNLPACTCVIAHATPPEANVRTSVCATCAHIEALGFNHLSFSGLLGAAGLAGHLLGAVEDLVKGKCELRFLVERLIKERDAAEDRAKNTVVDLHAAVKEREKDQMYLANERLTTERNAAETVLALARAKALRIVVPVSFTYAKELHELLDTLKTPEFS